MRFLRTLAALAAIVTVSVIQASLIGPIVSSLPVSLPAVLVAAVALSDGPAAGMAFGFSAGLIADLGSSHPAGVLALVWTVLGLLCGMAATGRSRREEVLTAATATALAEALTALLLTVVHSGGAPASSVVANFVPCWLLTLVLSAVVVPLVRRALRNPALRAPQPAFTEVRVVNRA